MKDVSKAILKICLHYPEMPVPSRGHASDAGMSVTLLDLDGGITWIKEELYQKMMHDKKTVNGSINFVLLKGLGEPFVCNTIEKEMVLETLSEFGAK